MSKSRELKFRKKALFVFEIGERDLWIKYAKRWIEELTADPFSIAVEAVDNREFHPDMLRGRDVFFLCNIRMPEPDGFEVLKQVHHVRPDIPVVVSSAMLHEAFKRRFDLPLSVTYLSKPFRLQELSDVFLNILFLEPARLGQLGVEVVSIVPFDMDVIKHLSDHDEELYKIPDRFFEELLAEILHKRGWEVQLSPIGADGGIDIVAIRKLSDISQMMLVQAKRYAEHRKVGVSTVRELLHVIDDRRATMGMIATTSTFTSVAIQERHAYKWKLSLKDHREIARWLHEYSHTGDHVQIQEGANNAMHTDGDSAALPPRR